MAQKDIKHLTEHDTKANKLFVLVVSIKYVKIQRKKICDLLRFPVYFLGLHLSQYRNTSLYMKSVTL